MTGTDDAPAYGDLISFVDPGSTIHVGKVCGATPDGYILDEVDGPHVQTFIVRSDDGEVRTSDERLHVGWVTRPSFQPGDLVTIHLSDERVDGLVCGKAGPAVYVVEGGAGADMKRYTVAGSRLTPRAGGRLHHDPAVDAPADPAPPAADPKPEPEPEPRTFDPSPLDGDDPDWDLLERAMGLICNAHHTAIDDLVDGQEASSGWGPAARWWLDRYNERLQARLKLAAVHAAAFHHEGAQRRAAAALARLNDTAKEALASGTPHAQVELVARAGAASYRAKNPEEPTDAG